MLWRASSLDRAKTQKDTTRYEVVLGSFPLICFLCEVFGVKRPEDNSLFIDSLSDSLICKHILVSHSYHVWTQKEGRQHGG